MKTEFPILALSPTQWVLVDKTRIPQFREQYWDEDNSCIDRRSSPANEPMEMTIYAGCLPILAAYPKIEGVLLLPSLLWEKKNPCEIRIAAHLENAHPRVKDVYAAKILAWFKKGYEAAGGYTREQVKQFPEWLIDGGWEFNKIARVWEHLNGSRKHTSALTDIYLKEMENIYKSPRALEIDVNEDGSIPSDNDTIIYNKAIY